jgi:hypothetical protein
MSTLVVLFAAGMTLGTGPEKVSGEVEQRLDLSGKWQLTNFDNHPASSVAMDGNDILRHWNAKDEGGGKFRLTISGSPLLGIYKHNGDRLMICIGRDEWPTFFRCVNGQNVLILRRVKSRK